MSDSTESLPLWLVLTHHLPTEPAYLRVKVRRRLDRIGAIPLKSSVYALPASDEALEDLTWLLQEIVREEGEASLAEATFVDGTTHASLVARCREAREEDYRDLARAASELLGPASEAAGPGLASKARRLARRLEEVKEMDFFRADGRAAAERAVGDAVRATSPGSGSGARARPTGSRDLGVGRTWVTRPGVKVDRIASAWLIRRFVDPDARFAFMRRGGAELPADAIPFDMFEGELTHAGEACTFETLLSAFGLDDPALHTVAEVVHDIDCKDDKFGRPETPGVGSLIDGIIRSHPDDAARLEHGAGLLDALLEHFRA